MKTETVQRCRKISNERDETITLQLLQEEQHQIAEQLRVSPQATELQSNPMQLHPLASLGT